MAAGRDPRSPCLIGVARRTWHPDGRDAGEAPEPLEMWTEVARDAAADSGGRDVLARLGRIDVVYCQSWQYDDPAGRLGDRIGASPRTGTYSGIGGTVPQVLVSQMARDVLAGRLDLGLVAGAEALATRRLLRKAGTKPQWSHPPAERRPFPFDHPVHPGEVAHQIFEAWLTFAIFDNAHRAHLGVGLDDYRRQLGELLSPMTAVAAADPHNAWFPVARGVDEIVGPTADNRMVGYPYSKLMTAIMDVDMAAAVLLASEEAADSLGVPAERRVYLRGWGYAEDPVHVASRVELWRSGGMAAAAAAALSGAGVPADAVGHLDLYSCFTSSIAFALDALGLDPARSRRGGPERPERPVTVTGGLPYHGGPGSNYMTHSLAAMAERLRAEPGAVGLVSGVGMHMNKHTFAAYSTEPGAVVPPDDEAVAAAAGMEERPVLDTYEGPARVATYSVVHGRDGEPEWGALVCDVDDGGAGATARCYARLSDPDVLAEAERTELVGRAVSLVGADGHTEARL